jgi:replicative DNA helicase
MQAMSLRSTSARENTDPLRLPPQAVEAEQSVLGSLLLDNSQVEAVLAALRPEDFYHRNHQTIFRAVCDLCDHNQPADVITVSEHLQKQGELDNIGGLAYLGSLANNTPSTANAGAYARIVHERAILRRLIQASNETVSRAFSPEGRTPREILDLAEQAIYEIAEGSARRSGSFAEIGGLSEQAIEKVEKLKGSKSKVTGLATGFEDLDEMTSGLQPGDLVIIAGRPSMGKTSLAMNIVEHVAIGQGKTVAVFSMEMPSSQLALRMLGSLSRVNGQRLRNGTITEEDWTRLVSAHSMLHGQRIFIDDTPALSPLEIRTRARRLAREHQHVHDEAEREAKRLALIVVDYLQLMQSTEQTENRATEIANITRSLKILAKELNVPLVALSQLNRSVESRPNKRPVMSDLRESGAVEQDADVILFIYRDEVYNEDSKDKGTAEVIIGKQRNGPIGTVRLTYLGHCTRFENYASPEFVARYRNEPRDDGKR